MVWTIRNWEAVYTFFAFDEDLSREERIDILKGYFVDYGFWEVLETTGVSLLVIVLSYFLLNVTRGIVNFFEKRVTPLILKKTGYNDVVPLEDYNNLLDSTVELDKKVSELKKERAELKLELEEIEKSKASVQAEINSIFNDKSKDELTELTDLNKIRIKAKKILEAFSPRDVSGFLKVVNDIKFDRGVRSNEFVEQISLLGLIKFNKFRNVGADIGDFELTELGSTLLDLINDRQIEDKRIDLV